MSTNHVFVRGFDRWAELLGLFNYFGSTNDDVSLCHSMPHGQGHVTGRWFHKTDRGWITVPEGVYIKKPINHTPPKSGGYHAPRSA